MLFMRLMLLARPNTTHEIDVADAARLTKLFTKLTLLITLISISRVILF